MAWFLFGIFVGIMFGSIGMLLFCAQVKDKGCEFCDNGDHLNLVDKYGFVVFCTYCPICGRKVN